MKCEIDSIDFLNARIDEIYCRKKHQVINGKEFCEFKCEIAPYFIRLERTLRGVYLSSIDLKTNENIDIDLLHRQFPFIKNLEHGLDYSMALPDGTIEFVNIIDYYFNLLDNLRNINLHAVISTPLCRILKIDKHVLSIFPVISNKIIYERDGILTVAGMIMMLLSVSDREAVKTYIDIIFKRWANKIWVFRSFEDFNIKKREFFSIICEKFKTEYDLMIQKNKDNFDLFNAIFGNERKLIEHNGNQFMLNLSKRLHYNNAYLSGKIEYNEEYISIKINEGSDIGVYYDKNYVLKIYDEISFINYARQLPGLVFLNYLYINDIDIFKTDTINNDLFENKILWLNKIKFYKDKDINILSCSGKELDIRKISKVIVDGVTRLLLDWEENIVFANKINVYGDYSTIRKVAESFNMPDNIKYKLIALRNYCAHAMLLNSYSTIDGNAYKITLDFILQTLIETKDFLCKNDKINHTHNANFFQRKIDTLFVYRLISCKYQKIFENSLKVFSQNDFKDINSRIDGLNKNFFKVNNSIITNEFETKMMNTIESEIFFIFDKKQLPQDISKLKYGFKNLYNIKIISDKKIKIGERQSEYNEIELLMKDETLVDNTFKVLKKIYYNTNQFIVNVEVYITQ